MKQCVARPNRLLQGLKQCQKALKKCDKCGEIFACITAAKTAFQCKQPLVESPENIPLKITDIINVGSIGCGHSLLFYFTAINTTNPNNVIYTGIVDLNQNLPPFIPGSYTINIVVNITYDVIPGCTDAFTQGVNVQCVFDILLASPHNGP